MPYIKLAMERSRKDWMKTAGKQKFRGTKASLYAYLKFSPMIYISISILILLLLFENSITIWYPPDWDLQDDHSLLHTNNLRGIDPYSRKVYYLETQCTCWLVVRSCDKKLRLQLSVPCWWRHWWSQFRAPPGNGANNLVCEIVTQVVNYCSKHIFTTLHN